MARSWSGAAQSGSRDYTSEDVAHVLEELPRGRQEAVSLRTFANLLGMEARTLRAILSDRDGLDWLMSYGDDLIYDVEYVEEARAHTERLRARAVSELERVGRRERYAVTLPRRQPELIPS